MKTKQQNRKENKQGIKFQTKLLVNPSMHWTSTGLAFLEPTQRTAFNKQNKTEKKKYKTSSCHPNPNRRALSFRVHSLQQ